MPAHCITVLLDHVDNLRYDVCELSCDISQAKGRRLLLHHRTLWLTLCCALCLAIVGCSKVTLPGMNAPRTPVAVATVANNNPARNARSSRNWAGYEVVRSGITSVSGTWQVPQVSAPADGDSSTWVGIGGDRAPQLIQAGTDQLMQHGQAMYYAWVEMLPDPPVQIKDLTILPGDTVTVTLTQANTQQWTLTFADKDAKQTVTQQLTYSSCNCSAEWVEEAPSVNGHETILSNFGSVTFTSVSATADGKPLNLANGGSRPIRMTNAAGQSLAVPQTAQPTSFSIVDVSATVKNMDLS